MKRILILGGAGFIGANLLEAVSKLESFAEMEIVILDAMLNGDQTLWVKEDLHQNVRVLEGDGNDAVLLRKTIRELSPDTCIHLAANSDIQKSSLNSDIEIANTFQTTLSLKSALEAESRKIDTFVFASSSAVFGNHSKPISNLTAKMPASPYGWMKLASEALLKGNFLNAPYSRLVILRFPNVSGKFQTHGVVYDLVRKLHSSGGKSLQVLGNGYQSKPYCLASELSQAILEFCSSKDPGVLECNYGPNDTITVREVVQIILEEAGCPDAQVDYGASEGGWVGDVPNYRFEREASNYQCPSPTLSSAQAIRESVQWALKNLN